ncbi:MAG: tripartite tricarboxylate transporter TctB family protein [Deltaproteobacteria bacterium]|nr:tripartite tricarboxylate transporter TctB family protein [Deltaproteobacteria bacterium]MBW1962154.1 tripartite tricarboxylate transporter TctB family protein [Deltaproteobacteria bacterium]MBW2154172.1 tripartite tricarboxylate transporter TctB family protein [Deltaproteobacteria bacterium]
MKKIWNHLSSDQKIAIFLVLFTGAMHSFIIPYGVEETGRPQLVSPKTFPTLITITLSVFSFMLFLKRYFAKNTVVKSENSDRVYQLIPPRLIIAVALFILYIFLTPIIGYLLTSIIIMPAFFILYGTRKKLLIVGLSIVLPFLLFWFFSKVMLVMLPQGIFF